MRIIAPLKEIKPKVYQLNEGQTLFLGGLARFDFISGNRASFIAYVSNDVNIHRTKLEKADEFYQKHVGGLLQPPRPDEVEAFPELVRFEFSVKEKQTSFCRSRLDHCNSASSNCGLGAKGCRCIETQSIDLRKKENYEFKRKTKAFLRSKAHHLQPIFQIGKGGINSAMIVQIEEALEKEN